jgi:hypothetical protein
VLDPARMDSLRLLRILGTFAVAWTVLYLRFKAGLVQGTEVDAMVHWALLPIALLLAAANAAIEMNRSASVPRRDAVWGLSAALASFGLLRLFKVL